jgi:hypothetical protein
MFSNLDIRLLYNDKSVSLVNVSRPSIFSILLNERSLNIKLINQKPYNIT